VTATSAASSPVGPSNVRVYPYGYGDWWPGYSWSTKTTAPLYTDEVTVVCPECGMQYCNRAASAAETERACDVWLAGHRAGKHQESAGE
jgi:hypothetical protein